jgi:DNA-binding transcriptional MerR regulator
MNSFTIKDIENLTGIKAHTLRIWEQRYNIICPRRKESKHRQYDNDDLKAILQISFLYHQGYKISKIASLQPEEIKQITLDCVQKNSFEVFVNQLMEAAIDFDQSRFEKIFHTMVLRVGFEKSIIHVIYPFLENIGILWMTGHVIPAQEHFASHLIRKKILMAIDGLESNYKVTDKKILLFAPEGEFHELPLLFIKYLFKKNGIPVTYFGVDTNFSKLREYLHQKQVTHLYFHVITFFSDDNLEQLVREILEEYPDKQLVISGPPSRNIEVHSQNLRILNSLNETIAFIMED